MQRKMSERDADELAKQRMQKMLKLAPPEKYTVVDLGEFGEDLRCEQDPPSDAWRATRRHPQQT